MYILHVFIPHTFTNTMPCIQSCPTLCDPVDVSPPGSSVHGDSPGKNPAVGCRALLQGIFPTLDEPAPLTSPALAGVSFTTSTACEVPVSSIERINTMSE